LDDYERFTGVRPAITDHVATMGRTYNIGLNRLFAESLASLENVTVGRRTAQEQQWPAFLFEDRCPKSIIREFLGGLFGGDGWSPHLVTNKQDGQGTVTFKCPAISQSAELERAEELIAKMRVIGDLAKSLGIKGCRVDRPKVYENQDGKKMVSVCLQFYRGTEFGDKIGYRYCVQKMYRMAAYQSYMRYLENVKRQNDFVVQRTSELYDNVTANSLIKALDMARSELASQEPLLNKYYSTGTIDQVRNRRRKDRFKELIKWDYDFIEDAEAYLKRIKAYHWFRTKEDKGGADYIIDRDAISMPFFEVRLAERRDWGEAEVFNIGVHETEMVTVIGLASANSLPSRMTVSYPLELLASKYGAMAGAHVNGGAFKRFELNKYRALLKEYGMDEFGYETLRSGTSGKPLEASIFMGPVFFQALKHHVKDKIQARSTGQVKPISRQPPKGRGNRGGLRLILGAVINKIIASFCHRKRHI
jgi:hypothetical protein